MADKTIVVAVNLDTKQATTNAATLNGEIAKLRATTADLKKEQAALAKNNQVNTERYKQLSNEIALNDAQIKNLSADYARQVKILQANSGSMEELRAITSAMTKQADKFRIGIDGTADELNALKESVRVNIEEIRAFDLAQGKAQANVGNYEQAIKNAIRVLQDENATLAENKAALEEINKTQQNSTKAQSEELNKQKLSLQQNIGQMEGRLDEFGDRIAKGNKEVFNTFSDLGQGITSAFAIAPLITFDEKNQKVAELAAHAQAAIAIATNAKAIAIGASSFMDAKDIALQKIKLGISALVVAKTKEQTVATNAGTVATKLFGKAFQLTPLGKIVALLGLVAGAFTVLYQKVQPVADAIDFVTSGFKSMATAVGRFLGIVESESEEKLQKTAANAKKFNEALAKNVEFYNKILELQVAELEASGASEEEVGKKRIANMGQVTANLIAQQKAYQAELQALNAIEKKNRTLEQKERKTELEELLRDQGIAIRESMVAEGNAREELAKQQEEAAKKQQEAEKKRAEERKKQLEDLQKLRDELAKANIATIQDEFKKQREAAKLAFAIEKRELLERENQTKAQKELTNQIIIAKEKELQQQLTKIDKDEQAKRDEEDLKAAEEFAARKAKLLEEETDIILDEQQRQQLAISKQEEAGIISKKEAERQKQELQLETLEKERAALVAHNQDTLSIDQQITDEKIRLAEQEHEAKQSLRELEKQAAKETFEIILQLYQNNLDEQLQANATKQSVELQQLQKLKDSSAITEEQFNQRKAAIDDKYNKQAAEIKRKQFIADRRASELRVIINTAEAITKSLAQGGGLFSAPLIAITAGLGALQLAAIESAPIPTFAKGGFTGNGILGPDSTGERPAGIVHAGEYVVPKDVLTNPIGANLVNQLEAMRGSAYPGYANGGLVADVANDAIDYDRLGMTLAKYIPSEVNVNSINRGQSQVQVRANRGALVNPGA